ncbi:restriction endonuclease [Thermotoga sp. RQ7]|uniref:restriction endonuclease n=1 Tax=Thermotoga sp. RQ7 TaxID=126738 RepID=UPI0005A33690|nr:restriction endonuclease [Thermotoga sp. RQ7]AJG41683.1 restriction endonuclease [Thermotoga sp. RQ7]
MIYVVLILLSFSLAFIWFFLRRRKRNERLRSLLKTGLKSPYRFEEFAREYLREHGFKKVRVTRKSKDFGADIVAKKRGRTVVFQVKLRSSAVEKSVVKELVAAAYIYGAVEVGVFTNGEISQSLEKELELLESAGGFIKKVHVVKNITPEEL